MRRFLLAAFLAAPLAAPVAVPARAEPVTLLLQPGTTVLGFRAYGLGMLPIDGTFARFRGTLSLDAADPAFCRMEVEAEAASLVMPSEGMTRDALGPDLLNVAVHPRFAYAGDCQAGAVAGSLTLAGVTKPLRAKVEREGGWFVATGMMRRAEWGMGARPMLAGPEVRIQVATGLPAALR